MSCKSSSGWDPLGSSSNSVFQYPVFKVPRLVSEGVPRQAARMYTTRFRRRCQRVFREIFPFRPKARRGREKGRGSRRTPSLARSAPRERDDPAFRGLHRSTSGDGGLSCRVRHGTGRSPPPWSRSRGALPALGALRGRPEGRMALLRRKPSFARDRAPGIFRARMARARAISTARLNASRRLQLRPIDLVVYEGPYRRENSSRRRLPA